jgi:hypothetical protein
LIKAGEKACFEKKFYELDACWEDLKGLNLCGRQLLAQTHIHIRLVEFKVKLLRAGNGCGIAQWRLGYVRQRSKLCPEKHVVTATLSPLGSLLNLNTIQSSPSLQGSSFPPAPSSPSPMASCSSRCVSHSKLVLSLAPDALYHLPRLNDPERSIKVNREPGILSCFRNPLTNIFTFFSVWCERSCQEGTSQSSRSVRGSHRRRRAN